MANWIHMSMAVHHIWQAGFGHEHVADTGTSGTITKLFHEMKSQNIGRLV